MILALEAVPWITSAAAKMPRAHGEGVAGAGTEGVDMTRQNTSRGPGRRPARPLAALGALLVLSGCYLLEPEPLPRGTEEVTIGVGETVQVDLGHWSPGVGDSWGVLPQEDEEGTLEAHVVMNSEVFGVRRPPRGRSAEATPGHPPRSPPGPTRPSRRPPPEGRATARSFRRLPGGSAPGMAPDIGSACRYPPGPSAPGGRRSESAQMTPKAIIASATLRKPATFAPST